MLVTCHRKFAISSKFWKNKGLLCSQNTRFGGWGVSHFLSVSPHEDQENTLMLTSNTSFQKTPWPAPHFILWITTSAVNTASFNTTWITHAAKKSTCAHSNATVTSEVLMAVFLDIHILWYATLRCWVGSYGHSEGSYFLHFQQPGSAKWKAIQEDGVYYNWIGDRGSKQMGVVVGRVLMYWL
jgi:hypothetical protein